MYSYMSPALVQSVPSSQLVYNPLCIWDIFRASSPCEGRAALGWRASTAFMGLIEATAPSATNRSKASHIPVRSGTVC
jgi:hypothetical protein